MQEAGRAPGALPSVSNGRDYGNASGSLACQPGPKDFTETQFLLGERGRLLRCPGRRGH